MIPFERNPQQTIQSSALKVIGLGGAGANMLDRAALDGMEGAELLALNTDMRTLAQSVAQEKIQLGLNLTKGLGAGGDPELGQQAVMEAEEAVRLALKGRKIVFLCVGLGGGTGSGAAPIVTRIAREEGAFVVVFATMPFGFEGQRRRDQAETALNELAVLSNALVTFDNGRMGELVLAKQGIHEAFSAADRMISESIKAVTRLVIKPGLVNVGLDDLVTALKTNRSRCLFGSGIASGKNRAQAALKNALSSPLLDRGSLLQDAESVLVHVSGGSEMTLYEVELLMQGLTKHVPATAHILFGAAIDEGMGNSLSVTIISALPENKLTATMPVREKGADGIPLSIYKKEVEEDDLEEDSEEEEEKEVNEEIFKPISARIKDQEKEKKAEPEPEPEPEEVEEAPEGFEELEWEDIVVEEEEPEAEAEEIPKLKTKARVEPKPLPEPKPKIREVAKDDFDDVSDDDEGVDFDDEKEIEATESKSEEEVVKLEEKPAKAKPKSKSTKSVREEDELNELDDSDWETVKPTKSVRADKPSLPSKKKALGSQAELELDGGPKGRFEGESPNLNEGEDLDIPPYLRKRSK